MPFSASLSWGRGSLAWGPMRPGCVRGGAVRDSVWEQGGARSVVSEMGAGSPSASDRVVGG